jgi:hypothetical protein
MAPPTPTTPAPQEDSQFLGFLDTHQGDPQASMFHAQMRLSLEGLIKLAEFIKVGAPADDDARLLLQRLPPNWLFDMQEGMPRQQPVAPAPPPPSPGPFPSPPPP